MKNNDTQNRIIPVQEGILISAADITERKQTEGALLESYTRYRSIFESDMVGSLFWDAEGNIAEANDEFLKIVGYSREDLTTGKLKWKELTPPEYDEIDKVKLTELAENGVISPFEKEYIHKNGRRIPIMISAATFPGTETKGAAIILDLSERKRAEEAQKRLTNELAQKNKEMEQIIYVTSHDLRSPLVNAQGFSKELESSLKEITKILNSKDIPTELHEKITPILEEDITEAIQYILSSITKMDSLLSGLLKLSRLGRSEFKKEKINMNKLLAKISDTFEYQVKSSDAKLEISELPSCIGDKDQINQVFSNLIDNALKYLDPKQPGKIKISGYNEKDHTIYCLEDNGIGIAPEYQNDVFEIFHQLDPSITTGEGLGLTIVRKILDKHDGKIWLESALGQGSKFFISLPGGKL